MRAGATGTDRSGGSSFPPLPGCHLPLRPGHRTDTVTCVCHCHHPQPSPQPSPALSLLMALRHPWSTQEALCPPLLSSSPAHKAGVATVPISVMKTLTPRRRDPVLHPGPLSARMAWSSPLLLALCPSLELCPVLAVPAHCPPARPPPAAPVSTTEDRSPLVLPTPGLLLRPSSPCAVLQPAVLPSRVPVPQGAQGQPCCLASSGPDGGDQRQGRRAGVGGRGGREAVTWSTCLWVLTSQHTGAAPQRQQPSYEAHPLLLQGPNPCLCT